MRFMQKKYIEIFFIDFETGQFDPHHNRRAEARCVLRCGNSPRLKQQQSQHRADKDLLGCRVTATYFM